MNSNEPDDLLPSPERPSNEFEAVTLELDWDDQDKLGVALKDILNGRKNEIQHLCGEFIDEDSQGRLTLDEDSFEVDEVIRGKEGQWDVLCHYTVSAYYGCSDMDIVEDERDCVISLKLDLDSQAIILKVPKRIERDTFEEF